MRTLPLTITSGFVLAVIGFWTFADDPPPAPDAVETHFRETIRPFVQTNCIGCHGKEKPKGELDLSIFTNSLWSGTRHDASKVPVILAGGLGGTLETGRVLDYGDKGDGNRKLCGMYLGIMDRMGLKLDEFGDARERLASY